MNSWNSSSMIYDDFLADGKPFTMNIVTGAGKELRKG